MANGNGEEILEYHQTILEKLSTDKELCEYILNRSITDEEFEDADFQEQIVENHIYPVLFVPYVQDSKEQYVCFDLNCIMGTGNNKNIKIDLLFIEYCHIDERKISFGLYKGKLRTDLISRRILQLFNNTDLFGLGKVECKRNGIFHENANYYGRQLAFSTTEVNAPKY